MIRNKELEGKDRWLGDILPHYWQYKVATSSTWLLYSHDKDQCPREPGVFHYFHVITIRVKKILAIWNPKKTYWIDMKHNELPFWQSQVGSHFNQGVLGQAKPKKLLTGHHTLPSHQWVVPGCRDSHNLLIQHIHSQLSGHVLMIKVWVSNRTQVLPPICSEGGRISSTVICLKKCATTGF